MNSCEVAWLGSRFHYPMIWWPENFYMSVYELTEVEEIESWQDIVTIKGYWLVGYDMVEAYNLNEIPEKFEKCNSDLAHKRKA